MGVESRYCIPHDIEVWYSQNDVDGQLWTVNFKGPSAYMLEIDCSPLGNPGSHSWELCGWLYAGSKPSCPSVTFEFDKGAPENLSAALKRICELTVQAAQAVGPDRHNAMRLDQLKRLWFAHLDRVEAFEPNAYHSRPMHKDEARSPSAPVLVVSGPSGVGKDTVAMVLLQEYPSFEKCVTCTTRIPRVGFDVDGVDYHFMDRGTFEEAVRDGKFLEYAEVHGNLYGTPVHEIDRIRAHGKIPLVILDPQGFETLKTKGIETIGAFIEPPSERLLRARLEGRGTESADSLEKRMADAKAFLAEAGKYDVRAVNDSLPRCAGRIALAYKEAAIGRIGPDDSMAMELLDAIQPQIDLTPIYPGEGTERKAMNYELIGGPGFDLRGELDAVWEKWFESLEKGGHWDYPEDFIGTLGYEPAQEKALTMAFVDEMYEDADVASRAEMLEDYGIEEAASRPEAANLSPFDDPSMTTARNASHTNLDNPIGYDAR